MNHRSHSNRAKEGSIVGIDPPRAPRGTGQGFQPKLPGKGQDFDRRVVNVQLRAENAHENPQEHGQEDVGALTP